VLWNVFYVDRSWAIVAKIEQRRVGEMAIPIITYGVINWCSLSKSVLGVLHSGVVWTRRG